MLEKYVIVIKNYVVMFLWDVEVLDLDNYPYHNKGPRPNHLALVISPIPFIDPNNTTINTLIARPLSLSPKCVCY